MIALTTVLAFQSTVDKTYFIVHCAGNPDAYGNYINKLQCQQYNETLGDWQDLEGHPLFDHEYSNTTGFEFEPEVGWSIRFLVIVSLNDTLASSVAEAETFTRVLLSVQRCGETGTTIEWIYDGDGLGLIGGSGPAGGFYDIVYYLDWDDNTAKGGFYYEVWIDYEVYY